MKLNKFIQQLDLIISPPLKFNQKLEAIKRIIATQLDFKMLNGLVSEKELVKLDYYIRNKINENFNNKGLQKSLFYTHFITENNND